MYVPARGLPQAPCMAGCPLVLGIPSDLQHPGTGRPRIWVQRGRGHQKCIQPTLISYLTALLCTPSHTLPDLVLCFPRAIWTAVLAHFSASWMTDFNSAKMSLLSNECEEPSDVRAWRYSKSVHGGLGGMCRLHYSCTLLASHTSTAWRAFPLNCVYSLLSCLFPLSQAHH